MKKGLLCGIIAIGIAACAAGGALAPAEAAAADYIPLDVGYSNAVSDAALSYHTWYSDDLFETNEENGALAKLSMAVAAATYSGAEAMADLVGRMGFQLVVQRNYDREATSADCDFVAYTIACRKIGDATLYGVFLRGTAADAQWYSNFNVGQGDVHRGFDTASQDVFNTLSSLITDDFDTNKIWITGHSRGAAVGNLLAERINSTEPCFAVDENVCAYNFAVPATTKKPIPYKNIFNYNIAGDIVAAIPLAEWGFALHGITYTYDASVAEAANEAFAAWTGTAYNGVADTQEFSAALLKWCPSQEDYYKKDQGFAPVDIITTYVVPVLAGGAAPSLQDVIKGDLLLYFFVHTEMGAVLNYFLAHSGAIVHGHAPVSYVAYTDAAFPHEHLFDLYLPNGDATCTEDGTRTATCYCGEQDTLPDVGSALGHDYQIVSSTDGIILRRCARCRDEYTRKDISYAEVGEIPQTEYLGEPIFPSVAPTFAGGSLVEDIDYTISYEGNDAVGTAAIVLHGIGTYEGEKRVEFEIIEHKHVFRQYVYLEDATCTEDGTERGSCYCGVEDVRTALGTALGHAYVLSSTDETAEVYACTRCGDTYRVLFLTRAEVAVDGDAFFGNGAAEEFFVVTLDGEVLSPDSYTVVSHSRKNGETSVTVSYVIEGKGGYTGRIEGSVSIAYPKSEHAWITWVSAAGGAVAGLGAIGGGIALGIRKRRG